MRAIPFPSDFVDLRKAPIEIHDIEDNVRDFYLCLDIDLKEDIKTQYMDARSFLDSARLLLRNLVSVEENSYIKEYEKAYIFMQENLGRVDKKINEIESENIDELNDYAKYSDGKKIIDSPFLRRYINTLVTCMEHLVYYPLRNSLKKYDETDKTLEGEKIIKPAKNLYLYFLFLELLHSSESLGSITAEKIRGKIQSISPNQPSERDSNETYSPKEDSPPSLPKNLEIEEIDLDEEMGKKAEEFFSEPSEEPEEDSVKTIYEDEDIEIIEEVEDEYN